MLRIAVTFRSRRQEERRRRTCAQPSSVLKRSCRAELAAWECVRQCRRDSQAKRSGGTYSTLRDRWLADIQLAEFKAAASRFRCSKILQPPVIRLVDCDHRMSLRRAGHRKWEPRSRRLRSLVPASCSCAAGAFTADLWEQNILARTWPELDSFHRIHDGSSTRVSS